MAHAVESIDEDFNLSRSGGVDEHGADGDGVARVSVRVGLELFEDGWVDFSGDGSGGGGVDFERGWRVEDFRTRD